MFRQDRIDHAMGYDSRATQQTDIASWSLISKILAPVYRQQLSGGLKGLLQCTGLPLQSTRNHSHSLSSSQVTASSVGTQAKPRLDGWKLDALHIVILLRSGGAVSPCHPVSPGACTK